MVHHQYPGSHWSKHPRLLTKHIDKYKESRGSVFYGTHTFEMLALILMRDYDKLADRFLGYLPSNAEAELFGCGTHDKSSVTTPKLVDGLSKADAAELIKKRLQACWWGPRATHKNAALLSSHAGESFARAKEWEEVRCPAHACRCVLFCDVRLAFWACSAQRLLFSSHMHASVLCSHAGPGLGGQHQRRGSQCSCNGRRHGCESDGGRLQGNTCSCRTLSPP